VTTLKPGDWATYAPDSLDNVTGTWVARIGRTFLVVAGVTNDSRVVVYDDETGDMLYPRAESMKPAASPILAAVTDLADTLRKDAEELSSVASEAETEWKFNVCEHLAAQANGVRLAASKLDAIIRTHKGE
jgi:hypothetical protein